MKFALNLIINIFIAFIAYYLYMHVDNSAKFIVAFVGGSIGTSLINVIDND